jgi:hypothetical protein
MRRKRSKPTEPEDTSGEAFAVDARFVAARELFARARSRVTAADVERYAPNDPGYPEYVAAFQAIVRRGEAALDTTFAVTETIALTRWGHAPAIGDPTRFRWFRVLTCAAEILIDQSECPHYGLVALLVDSFALAEARDAAAPIDLLSAVCREVAAHPLRASWVREYAFCILGELLLASVDRLDPAAIEALCVELEQRDRHFREWWEHEGAYWVDQPASDEFLWSLTNYDQLHPVWLDLVRTRFPTDPPAAAAMKQRLLIDGSRWADLRRALS